MRNEILQANGKRKVVERQLTINCAICGEQLFCPKEADPWFWLKCGDALDFFKAHREHGNWKTVSAEIKVLE